MIKLLVILALCLPALLVAQMTYVPDDNFEQALIDLGYDTPPLNNYVPTKNVDTVTFLDVSIQSIYDLTGIEDFVSLTNLDCSINTLTSLDVSNNSALISLDCSYNSITSLNVSGCSALSELRCRCNDLTSLDVSKNTLLNQLYCPNNNIKSLDVTNNTGLTEFICFDNSIPSLDVSKNTALIELKCEDNYLTSLDVSKNTALSFLDCRLNDLKSLDVKGCSALTGLFCSDNSLTNLNVSKNSALTSFSCYDNLLTNLDVSNNSALKTLNCRDNPDLYCIQVSDSVKAANNQWAKDEHAVWSEDCSLVSVEEENTTTTLTPNPAKDYVEISGVVGEVKVYDVLGNNVLSLGDSRFRGNDMMRLDVSSLSPGVYFVSVGGKMYKFVKI